jgi:hypothetical protein
MRAVLQSAAVVFDPPMHGALVSATTICRALSDATYRFRSEAQLQTALDEAIRACGVPTEREAVLEGVGRLDLWLPAQRVAVEAKTHGSLSQALRQVERYLRFAVVQGAIIASSQRWAQGRQDETLILGGKPVYIVRAACHGSAQ